MNTLDEVAAYFRIPRKSVIKLIRNGHLRTYRGEQDLTKAKVTDGELRAFIRRRQAAARAELEARKAARRAALVPGVQF